MFIQIDKGLAIRIDEIEHVAKEYYEHDKSWSIAFVGRNRDYYANYDNEKDRDFAFHELLRHLGAIEWKSN